MDQTEIGQIVIQGRMWTSDEKSFFKWRQKISWNCPRKNV